MTPDRSKLALLAPPLGLALALPFALAGCGLDEVTINEPLPQPPAAQVPVTPSLPRLPDGPHLGMITGFEPLNAARAAVAAQLYGEARQAGMTLGRVQIDWAELEPAPGQFDQAALDEAFADPNLAGLNLVVLISTLDSEGLTLPAYLQDGENLRSGLTLASPEVTDAFARLLDWIGPQLEQRNVWLVSLGNEVIGPIEDAKASEADALTFYTLAMDRWNARHPDIGVTVTHTLAAPAGIPALFAAVRARADIVTFNYYCLNADITVAGQAEWEARTAQMKADAGDRDIFLQELGCPVGYGPRGDPSTTGGSLENQVRFFEYFGEVLATDPQFRAATLFQLFDWSPELAAQFRAPLDAEGMPLLGARLEEWLATVGLVRWSDQTRRPAWQAWLEANRTVRGAR